MAFDPVRVGFGERSSLGVAPRWSRAAAIVLLVLGARTGATQEAVHYATPLALPCDPAVMTIDGVQHFTTEQVREGLLNDLDVAVARYRGFQGNMSKVLVERTVAGYHRSGFPDASAAISGSGGASTLRIVEGQRFMAGEVRVEGAKKIDAAKIIAGLQAADGPSAGPKARWPAGQPACFDQPARRTLADRATWLLAAQGYCRASCSVRTELDRERGIAHLVIAIDDEGAPAAVAEIKLSGNQRDSHEAVLAYLGLSPDERLTQAVREQVAQKLISSGRFTSCQWRSNDDESADEGRGTTLCVEEYHDAPPLADRLSREEEALLKFSDWVAHLNAHEDDLVVRFGDDDEWLEIVVAHNRGFLVIEGPGGEVGSMIPLRSALVVSEEEIGLYSIANRRKLVAVPPPARMRSGLSLTLVNGAPRWDGLSVLMCSALMKFGGEPSRRHVDLALKQSAAAALSVVRKHHAKCTWQGDVMTARWSDRSLAVDARTGRLVEHLVGLAEVPDAGDAAPEGEAKTATDCGKREQPDGHEDGDDDPSPSRIYLKAGAFDHRLAELKELSADFGNRADASRPFSCLAEFVLDELAADKRMAELPACRRASGVLAKMSSRGLWQPVDAWLIAAAQPAQEHFLPPLPYAAMTRVNDIDGLLCWAATYWGLPLGDYLFGRTGWAAELWRTETLMLAHRQSFMCPPATAPLRALTTAAVMHQFCMDEAAARTAAQGLWQIATRAFEADCRELLEADTFCARAVGQVASLLRDLSASETKDLIDAMIELDCLDGQTAAWLADVLAVLRRHRNEPISEAVIACLTHGWRTGLSGWVDTALEDFVSLSKSPERVFDPLRTEPDGYGAAAEEEAAGQYPTAESSTVPTIVYTPSYERAPNEFATPTTYGPGDFPAPATYEAGSYGAAAYGQMTDGPPEQSDAGQPSSGTYGAGPPLPIQQEGGLSEEVARLSRMVQALCERVALLELRLSPPQREAANEPQGDFH